MASFQVSGLQEYVRNHCRLAKLFEQKVLKDPRFQVNITRGGVGSHLLAGDERRQGRPGLLQADWVEPAQPEAPHHHQRVGQAPHGDKNGVDC